MERTRIQTITLAGLVFAVACEPAAEYRAALPKRSDVTVPVPERTSSSRGLGASRQALVGEKSDFYTETYYTSRALNGLGRAVVDLVEGISNLPPTKVGEDRAVWGPFSDDAEPNEFMMTVERIDGDLTRYDWRIEGKHKADERYATLASGTFEPTGDDLGRGWFELDFDAVRALDPTEEAKGRVAYAFEKTKEAVSVRLRFAGPNEDGEPVEAGYAFGEDAGGSGYILFAFPGDIHEEDKPGSALEDVLIRTRWQQGGAGRADVVAKNGDLGDRVARASQCWDDRFISRYESFEIEGTLEAEVGKESACVLEEAMLPVTGELPKEADVANPYSS